MIHESIRFAQNKTDIVLKNNLDKIPAFPVFTPTTTFMLIYADSHPEYTQILLLSLQIVPNVPFHF